jgi:hypothetical protein
MPAKPSKCKQDDSGQPVPRRGQLFERLGLDLVDPRHRNSEDVADRERLLMDRPKTRITGGF